MFDHLHVPAPSISSHVVGKGYDFDDVRTALGGESTPPHFAIHRDGAILGLCLGLTWNPRAELEPAEVWVGRKGELPKWGVKLAETSGPLPVYVRREEGGQWFYAGLHEVTGSTAELPAIRERIQPPLITGISRIVFLKRLPTATTD